MKRFRINNIVYELTGACNQCCRFCYNYWRPNKGLIEKPDTSKARRTLKKMLSQASVGTLSFSGGEPLLISNIHELVLAARFKGARVNILTNGTLLTDEALDSFLSLGVDTIQIPLLSADEAIHDYLTGLSGSWEKAHDALKRSGEAGVGTAVLVITRLNAPGLPDTLSLIKECGITTVMVNRFNIGGNGIRNIGELMPSRECMSDAFATVDAFAAAHPEMHFVSGVCTPLCYMETGRFTHVIFTKCSTSLSERPVTVNYNGDVRFCNHSPNVLGNIYERHIADILEDPEINARYAVLPDECSNCALLSRCGGGCRAAAEQLHGTFAALDPIIDFSSVAKNA